MGENLPEYAIQVFIGDRMSKSPQSRGPLAALDKNPYYYTATKPVLRYPADLGDRGASLYPHFIKFNINAREKSKYVSTFALDATGAGNGQGVADANRDQYNQLGSTGDGVIWDSNGKGTMFAAGAGAGAGFITGATDLLSSTASGLRQGGFVGAGAAAAASLQPALATGVAGGALAGLIAAQIDLSRQAKRLQQTIHLYIPDQVVQQNSNKYGEISMTAALGAMGFGGQAMESMGSSIGDTFKAAMSLNLKNLGSGLGSMFNSAKAPLIEAQAGILGGLGKKLGVFGEGIENVILQSYGYAQNPQIELLFENTDFRKFQYTFNFLPRNEKESQEVLEIIRMFRFHAAPEIPTYGAGRYYIPPSEFDIAYMYVDPTTGDVYENEAMHKFSTCILESIDVNYVGGADRFTTFKDGAPVNINLVLNFKEIEVIHKDLVERGF